MNYLALLRQLHKRLLPQTYLEIGVQKGKSLRLSHAPITIGIDPQPRVETQDLLGKPGVAIHALTSDAFFAGHERESVLHGGQLDLSFIDGLHQFDQVLRDFINVERWSSCGGTVVVHDVIPPSESAASRERVDGHSCGDVWQIVTCLRSYRPDLDCLLVDTSPSGLLIVRNLDPSSDVLSTNVEEILRAAPRDGKPYKIAVRNYLANVSVVSAQEAIDDLSKPAPKSSISSGDGHHPAAAGGATRHSEPLARRLSSGQINSPRDPAIDHGEPAPEQHDERGTDGVGTVQFENGSALPRPLDASDFSFYGFGDALPRIDRLVRSVGIRDGAPTVTTVDNAIFAPHESGRFNGGVFDAAGQFVAAADLARRGCQLATREPGHIEPSPESELDEELVYLGGYFPHFGHFLLESLARSWILSEIDPRTRVVFKPSVRIKPGSVPSQILEALGVSGDRVLVLNRPTRVRRLIVPEPLYELGFAAHRQAADQHRLVASRLMGDAGAGQSDQPVYLSRRFLPSDRRRLVEELLLEDVLRENGFVVVDPDMMNLADQIRIFNRHADIVCLEGSGAHTVLFALHGPKLHLLSRLDIIPDYFLTSSLARAQTTFIRCVETGSENPPKPVAYDFPARLDMKMLTGYLANRGLLQKAFTAEAAAGIPSLDKESNDLLVYARIANAMRNGQIVPESHLAEGATLAMDFWPLSLLLAYHQTSVDALNAESLARQFIGQVAREQNLNRLIVYRRDVERFTPEIASRCDSGLGDILARTVATHFAIDLPAILRRKMRPARPTANARR